MKPLRVLVVGWTATTGGIEHFLMAYCGKMNRERVQFDFLCRFSPIACQKKRKNRENIHNNPAEQRYNALLSGNQRLFP